MGSVISYIECPNCRSEECFEDFYYKTGEVYTRCPECGYVHDVNIKRDDNGKAILTDLEKEATFDNITYVDTLIENPYGSYRANSVKGGATVGTLRTKEDYDNLVADIAKNAQGDENLKSVIVSRFTEGKIVKETLFERG